MRSRGKRLLFCIFFISGFIPGSHAQKTVAPEKNYNKKFHTDVVVLKFKTSGISNGRISVSGDGHLATLKDLIGYESHHQVFPQRSISSARLSTSGLQNIYKLKLRSGANIWRQLARINKLDFIEYAEPFFQNELLFVPNDPQASPNGGLQDYLTVIRAYDGWQIDRSDSSVVIGIIDTGVNMGHEDLGNIAFNHADPINGTDDDDDGYVDNFYGWDLSDNDNDPTADGHPHGTPVAGMSSATTNNGIGMAGIGFQSKYLPVKIAETASQILTNEYEGIVYAADHGCKVINLSWGAAGSYSRYGQDIINYAVLEKNVVVVAAAGNTHEELDFYPASYDHVLSVGATDMGDNLASWATYSHFIDITAPGNNVYSTKNNGGYEKTTGSSFAAPMVAGAAALVKAHFPEFEARQVMEQLRVTSDDIYDVGSNMNYYGQMGKGRLNVRRALSDILTPSVRVSNYRYEGNHKELIFPGDTVAMTLTFTNFLRTAENLTITVSNLTSNVTFEADQIYINSLKEFESFEDIENPLYLVVDQDVNPGERLLFRVDFVGNNYRDFQYIDLFTTPEYFDVSDGNLTVTISSDGDIGFDESGFLEGNGVSFKENFIASETGLIVSLDSNHVMDNVVNNYSSLVRDEDFIQETEAKLYDNSLAEYDARSVFRPNDTIPSALDLKIEQKILTWENTTNDGYIIFEYRLINTGDTTLTGLHAGIYADWDLGAYQSNEARWDASNDMGYVFDKYSNALYSGMALLTDQTVTYYSIDKESLNGNMADVDVRFDDVVKHGFLSSSSPKPIAGIQGEGNDVAQIVGYKDLTLEPNKSIKISFALLASTSHEGLLSALDLAKSNYTDYLNDPPLGEVFYACHGDSALVNPVGEAHEFYSDSEGTLRLDSGSVYKTKPVVSEQVYYAVNLDSGYASDIAKLLVRPGDPTADFLFSADTLLIESGQSGSMQIENSSILGDQWMWDFDNGYTSLVEKPTTSYDAAGLYDVELIASNSYGCSDTISKQLMVAERAVRPEVAEVLICKGERAEISASNTSLIKVYGGKDLSEVLYLGDKFTTDPIAKDTTFYVVNSTGAFESVALPVQVRVKHLDMEFDVRVDTTDLNQKYLLTIFNTGEKTDAMSWLIDGELMSTEESFSYVYSDQSFEIAQIKEDGEGCLDTLMVTVVPEYSALPSLQDQQICRNTGLTITPKNGDLFYFYEDRDLTNLLHKGRTLSLQHVGEPMDLFITGMDGLLESTSVSIKITPDPVRAIIQASADTIDLADEHLTELRNISENAIDSYWSLSTGTFDTTKVITESYQRIGTYRYTLVAEGSSGCFDTAYHTVRVVNVTGLEGDIATNMIIYPNPVSNALIVDLMENTSQDLEFELFDTSGKRLEIFKMGTGKSQYQLDFYSFKPGLYFIRSVNTAHRITAKIIKK